MSLPFWLTVSRLKVLESLVQPVNHQLHPFLLAHKAQERLENVSALVWAQEIEHAFEFGWNGYDETTKKRALGHLKELALQKLSSLMVKNHQLFEQVQWLNIFKSLVAEDRHLVDSQVIFPPLLLVFLEYDQPLLIQWWQEQGGSFEALIGTHLHMPELKNVKDCILALGSKGALYRAGVKGVDLRAQIEDVDFTVWQRRADKSALKQAYLSGYELFLLEGATGEGSSKGGVKSL